MQNLKQFSARLIAVAFILYYFCIDCITRAADIQAGYDKAFICAECHGEHGVSILSQYPNLAGQKYEYLVQQLHAFKNGDRQNPTMQVMAQNLSQADIENLAAYFSALACR